MSLAFSRIRHCIDFDIPKFINVCDGPFPIQLKTTSTAKYAGNITFATRIAIVFQKHKKYYFALIIDKNNKHFFADGERVFIKLQCEEHYQERKKWKKIYFCKCGSNFTSEAYVIDKTAVKFYSNWMQEIELKKGIKSKLENNNLKIDYLKEAFLADTSETFSTHLSIHPSGPLRILIQEAYLIDKLRRFITILRSKNYLINTWGMRSIKFLSRNELAIIGDYTSKAVEIKKKFSKETRTDFTISSYRITPKKVKCYLNSQYIEQIRESLGIAPKIEGKKEFSFQIALAPPSPEPPCSSLLVGHLHRQRTSTPSLISSPRVNPPKKSSISTQHPQAFNIIKAASGLRLEGEIKQSDNGFTYLSVSPSFIYMLCRYLDKEGFISPADFFRDEKSAGAHATIISARELKGRANNPVIPPATERNVKFTLGEFKIVTPERWDGVSKAAILEINAEQLAKVREDNKLSPFVNGNHQFHITFAVKY